MDMVSAAKETILLWEESLKKGNPQLTSKNELTYGHCASMVRTMERGISKESGEKFSEGKMGRWLGWIQACAVMNSAMSLEDMKALNIKYASK